MKVVLIMVMCNVQATQFSSNNFVDVLPHEDEESEDDIFEEFCSSKKDVEGNNVGDIKIEIKEECIIDYNETIDAGGVMKNNDNNLSANNSNSYSLDCKESILNIPKHINEETVDIRDRDIAILEVHTNKDSSLPIYCKEFVSDIPESIYNDKTRHNSEQPNYSTGVLHDIVDLTNLSTHYDEECNNEETTITEIDDVFTEGESDAENSETTLLRNESSDGGLIKSFNLEQTFPSNKHKFGDTVVHINESKVCQNDGESVSIVNEDKLAKYPEHTVKIIETVSCDILNNQPLNAVKGDALKSMEKCDTLSGKSAECTKENYRKLLGTSEELLVCLKRENLHEIQKSHKKKQFTESTLRKTRNPAKHFGCKLCPYTANRRFDLIKHISGSHKKLAAEMNIQHVQNMFAGQEPNSIWYKCPECVFVTERKCVFSYHILTHKQLHEVETFSCASCSYITKVKQNLINHIERHKEMEIHKCPHCNFTSSYKSYMKKHVKLVHKLEDVPIFKCKKCTFKTVYKETLQHHVLLHNKSRKLYKCHLCPFQTMNKATLKSSHYLRHKTDEEGRRYECAHCVFKAKTRGDLIKHLLIHKRPDEVVMHKCDKCPFQTRHRCGLRRHQLQHQDLQEIDFIPCSLCSYQAKSKDHLRQHMRLKHPKPEEIKMYSCQSCAYQSRFSTRVKRHSLTHKPAKEITFYHCDSCSYKGKRAYDVNTHFKKIHASPPKEAKWYKCDQCDLQFGQPWVLKRHVASHKDLGKKSQTEPVKPNMFYCYHCSYHTKRKHDLVRHIPKHTNVFLHCDKCNFQTRYRACMLRHTNDQH